MTIDIESRIRDTFVRLADDVTPAVPHAFEPDRLTSLSVGADPQPRYRYVVLAVAAVLVLVAGAALAVRDDTQSIEPAAPPAVPATTTDTSASVGDGAVLLPDGSSGPVEVKSDQAAAAFDEARGAVLSPNSVVFGLIVTPPVDTPDPAATSRVIDGREVRAVVDGSAPAEIYRTISADCGALTITTAGEDMWSDETLALLNGVSVDGSQGHVELPPGWHSLGASAALPQLITELTVGSGDDAVDVTLQQMAGGRIGYFLAATETPPRGIVIDGSTAWAVDGATSPGFRSVIGQRHGVAYNLSGFVSEERLTEIASTLDPVAELPTATGTEVPASLVTVAARPACEGVSSLSIAADTTPGATDPATMVLLDQPPPPLEGSLDNGESFDLESLGGRWVVVRFTSGDCAPCVSDDASLQDFARADASSVDPVAIVSVVERGAEVPVAGTRAIDPDGSALLAFGISAVPATVVIDPEGLVRYLGQGITGDTVAQILSDLRSS